MTKETISLRPIRESDLDACLRLTQAARWPHRLHDWQLHYDLGDGWVAVQNGKIVGVTMWWRYSDQIATVGLVVVDRAQQGRGIGGRLMDVVIDRADADTLKLMATRAGLKLYQNCGFVAVGEIGQIQGEVSSVAPIAAGSGITLRAVRRDDLPHLIEIDARAFGAKRTELLSAFLRDGHGVIALRDGQQAAGFALIRNSGHGQTIGPVVAPDQSLAIALVSNVLAGESGFIRLDVDLTATDFIEWLEGTGLKCIDTVLIMTRPEQAPQEKPLRTYGLVSQAFG